MLKKLSIFLLLVGLKHVTCCAVPEAVGSTTCEPAFGAPAHGSVRCTNENFRGSECTFECDEGYEMVGDGESKCVLAGHAIYHWTNRNAPICERIPACEPAFEAPIHGSVSCTNDNFLGSECTFDCDEGYEMVGEDKSVCVHEQNIFGVGFWTNKNAPTCERIPACEPFEAPIHGSLSCTADEGFWSVCTFYCDEGYEMVGKDKSICVPAGHGMGYWTNRNAPRCSRIPTCDPAFEAPFHGSVSCDNENFYASVCTFECDEGYEMVGKDKSVCIARHEIGYWTNRNAPFCESILQPPVTDGMKDIKKYNLQRTSGRGSFKECQNMCDQQGGTLAQHSLSSKPGYDYKDDMMVVAGYEPMWIGVKNDNSQHQWRYTSIGGGKKPFPIDDTTSLIGKWRNGQPIINNYLCATIYKTQNYGLEFSTLTCEPAESKQRYGICEIP